MAAAVLSAKLVSSHGDVSISFELQAPCDYVHDPGYESRVQFEGKHHEGDYVFASFEGSRTFLSLEGVWLSRHELLSLSEHLRSWLGLPLDQLEAGKLDGAFHLARMPGQSFSFLFASRQHTPASRNPVITVSLEAGGLGTEVHFVTDQSCLAIFLRELIAALEV